MISRSTPPWFCFRARWGLGQCPILTARDSVKVVTSCVLFVLFAIVSPGCKSSQRKKDDITLFISDAIALTVLAPKSSEINVDATLEIERDPKRNLALYLVLHYYESEKDLKIDTKDNLELIFGGAKYALACLDVTETIESKAVLEGVLADILRADSYYAQALKYRLEEQFFLKLVKSKAPAFKFASISGLITLAFQDEMRSTYNKAIEPKPKD